MRTKANEQGTEEMRINKFISDTGICSRREADKLIGQGRVSINGETALMGSKVHPEDSVKIDGKPLKQKEKTLYIAFNKPVGVICTTDRRVRDNIVDYIRHPKRIFPVGRLDRDSEGLILLTNDGDIVNKILRAGNNHEKEYVVTVDRPVTSEFIQAMGSGVRILGTITKRCRLEKLSQNAFRIVLTEGMNRQIRRMCEAFGYRVVRLKRVRIMNISLKDLPTGKWRYLTRDEITLISSLVAGSVKTEEASHR